LYAVNELREFEDAPTGAVSAFSVEPGSGRLRFLNRKPSYGTDPCHLTVDKGVPKTKIAQECGIMTATRLGR
jgi:6-phosphogluconolactonase